MKHDLVDIHIKLTRLDYEILKKHSYKRGVPYSVIMRYALTEYLAERNLYSNASKTH